MSSEWYTKHLLRSTKHRRCQARRWGGSTTHRRMHPPLPDKLGILGHIGMKGDELA
jgi:hypothetical protein